MEKEDGEIAVHENKKVAYVSQQAWIMNTSVKELRVACVFIFPPPLYSISTFLF